MTQFQIAKYKHLATFLTKRAGLELVTIDPLDDYVETICPECKKINIFGKKDFHVLCCSRCRTNEQKNWYLRRSQELVEAAGFVLSYISYEDDYIEIECKKCNNISAFRFKELPSVHCKFCLMEKIAWANDYQMYSADTLPKESVPKELYKDVFINYEDFANFFEDEEPYGLFDMVDVNNDLLFFICNKCGRFLFFDRYNENVLNYVKNLKCPCRLIPKLKRIATSRGFSLEQANPSFNFYSLKQNELAVICNCCGQKNILDLYDVNLVNKIRALTCKNTKYIHKSDYIALTRRGNMSWCCDMLMVLSTLNFSQFNHQLTGIAYHLKIPTGNNYEIYFASDPNDKNYAIIFVIYPEENDEWRSRYLLLRLKIETWNHSKPNMICIVKNPSFYSELYTSIKHDIFTYFTRPISVAKDTIDAYINMYNKTHNLNKKYWDVMKISLILNIQKKIVDLDIPTREIRYPYDPRLRQYLKLHVCPVCGKFYASTEKTCLHCVFEELDHTFSNIDDEEEWDTNVLLPAQRRYNAYFTASFDNQLSKIILSNIKLEVNPAKSDL